MKTWLKCKCISFYYNKENLGLNGLYSHEMLLKIGFIFFFFFFFWHLGEIWPIFDYVRRILQQTLWQSIKSDKSKVPVNHRLHSSTLSEWHLNSRSMRVWLSRSDVHLTTVTDRAWMSLMSGRMTGIGRFGLDQLLTLPLEQTLAGRICAGHDSSLNNSRLQLLYIVHRQQHMNITKTTRM